MKSLWRVSAVLVVLWLVPAHGEEQVLRGVALVIGADNYEHLPVLTNAANDARAMDDLLSSLGFEVTRVLNRDADRLRDAIADFELDAKSADVALVYYSGHGVEVGGRNFLVPIDADIGTPKSAGESLIALDGIVDALNAITPTTIVLLDACRSEAFPAGTMVQLPGSDEAVASTATGLAQVSLRGPKAIAKPDRPATTMGMAIGFAAQPGSPAYDGVDGSGHSPYAAALLKHFSTGGYSFGDLMTMVTEEVYLKTGSQQLPSTVSSLLGVLTFGEPPAVADADEAAIADGRRQLLLNIARAPAALRQQVEAAAADAAVPMDALYGLLNAMGEDLPSDPSEIERLLAQQTETIRKLMVEHAALVSSDTEIVRLSGLAQRALDEGLIDKNLEYRRAAEARWDIIRADILATATQAKERLLEGVTTVAQTAEALRLGGDYLGAGQKYAEAYEQIIDWDVAAARNYKWDQAEALRVHGDRKGDNSVLSDAIAAYRVALDLTPRNSEAPAWASLQNDIGIALGTLGNRTADASKLAEGIEAYRSALEVRTRESAPLDWAQTQNNLGVELKALAGVTGKTVYLDESVEAYTAALEERTRDRVPELWAQSQSNLANVLVSLYERRRDRSYLERATAAYRAALEERTRERDALAWAQSQANLGNALELLGELEDGTASFEASELAYRSALEELTRERLPLEWAQTNYNLGLLLRVYGERQDSVAILQSGIDAFRAALEEQHRDRVPRDWAKSQHHLGRTLLALGAREDGIGTLEDAVVAFGEAQKVWTRAAYPFDWAEASFWSAETHLKIGDRADGTHGAEHWQAAVDNWSAAAEIYDRETDPEFWGRLRLYAGEYLTRLGQREGGNEERFTAAIPLLREALELQIDRYPNTLPYTQANLGIALFDLGRLRADRSMLLEAKSLLEASLVSARNIGRTFNDVPGRIEEVDAALAAL